MRGISSHGNNRRPRPENRKEEGFGLLDALIALLLLCTCISSISILFRSALDRQTELVYRSVEVLAERNRIAVREDRDESR